MSTISVVIPVFHNAPSVPELMQRLGQVAERNPADQFEFIFVDDGSKDESYRVLKELAAADKRVRLLKLSRNFGSNAAVLAGLAHASGDAVGAIAADLQDPPELFDEMLQGWRKGQKVVLAVRRHRYDPGITKLMASIFYRLFRRFALPTMPAGGFDFFLIDRQVSQLITGIQESNTYLMGLILWLGFDPQLIHYDRQERSARYGRSMWTTTKKLKYFVDSFVAFSYAPVRFASILGILLAGAGFAYALAVLAFRLFAGAEPAGFASLMVVLLVASGAQMLTLGILGEYVWRNLEETRKRPRFIVDSSSGWAGIEPESDTTRPG